MKQDDNNYLFIENATDEGNINIYTNNIILWQIQKLEGERDQYRKTFEPLKLKLREIEEAESGSRIALEKAERDVQHLKEEKTNLSVMFDQADADARKSEAALKALDAKFKVNHDYKPNNKFKISMQKTNLSSSWIIGEEKSSVYENKFVHLYACFPLQWDIIS